MPRCVLLSLLGCLLLGLGFLRFNSVSAARELWVDQNSQQMKDLEWTEQYFEAQGRPCRLLFTAKDGGNILELEKMQVVAQVADDVRALVDENGNKFEDFCIKVQGSCFNSGVLRYIGSTADFNQTMQTTSDILSAVSSGSFPDGADAYPSDTMGGVQIVNGSVTSATAVRIDFILRVNGVDEELLKAWELALVLHFTENDLSNQIYDHVNVFVNTQRASDDELSRTVQADIPLFAVAFNLMSIFCAIFLGKAASWTQSRRLLGALEFFLVLFGIIAGYGTAMLLGVPFTVLRPQNYIVCFYVLFSSIFYVILWRTLSLRFFQTNLQHFALLLRCSSKSCHSSWWALELTMPL